MAEELALHFPVFGPHSLVGVLQTVSLDVRYVALDPDIPVGRCGTWSVSGPGSRTSSTKLRIPFLRPISHGGSENPLP